MIDIGPNFYMFWHWSIIVIQYGGKTDVKCVKFKSDRRSIYRVNEFYGIHC